ncbi:DNA-deoxyinosine glycosylase [Chitinimonas koreensis]|uniref:DNA-deoxyinosine glycosylase n=1 Tax=Chitinimonas koreensis TaxID=356302 RepID=UPI0004082E19|nr:DNA-deoxyinosine glycosylase [Chitinimonas koreensis]QNM95377.1 DNA-deoxyinosine glycosylase [Chitinimonas koreensis]
MNAPKRCFPPVVDAGTRLLILGSLPGEVSLAHAQYYAHPQNRFWELAGAVIGQDLRAQDYEGRLATLLRHGVGLWDVVAQARRAGSLDSSIRDHVGNDLAALLATLPQLAAIAFNGGTAATLGLRQLGDTAQRYAIFRLPSSSPAHTLPLADKLAAWQALNAVLAPRGAQDAAVP